MQYFLQAWGPPGQRSTATCAADQRRGAGPHRDAGHGRALNLEASKPAVEKGVDGQGVLRDMKRRGLNCPKLVVGNGALGAWAALRDVFSEAGEQPCWVHKTANVLDCLPKRLHVKAKEKLHEIIEAPTRADAARALEVFCEECG